MHLSKEGINFSRCLAASLSIISGVCGKYWREGHTALKNKKLKLLHWHEIGMIS
jgi:hypothetical protein